MVLGNDDHGFAIPCIALEQYAFGKGTAKGVVLCEAQESSGLGWSAIEQEQSMLATAFVCGYELEGPLRSAKQGTAPAVPYCTCTVHEKITYIITVTQPRSLKNRMMPLRSPSNPGCPVGWLFLKRLF